jgi:hypothetical protein
VATYFGVVIVLAVFAERCGHQPLAASVTAITSETDIGSFTEPGSRLATI